MTQSEDVSATELANLVENGTLQLDNINGTFLDIPALRPKGEVLTSDHANMTVTITLVSVGIDNTHQHTSLKCY